MKTKEFYKKLAQEIDENTLPEYKHIVRDMKITSLEQALGVFRAIMIRNREQHENVRSLKHDLTKLMDVIGIEEKDL